MRLSLLSKVEDAHEDAVWTAAWAGPELLLTGEFQLLALEHREMSFIIAGYRDPFRQDSAITTRSVSVRNMCSSK